VKCSSIKNFKDQTKDADPHIEVGTAQKGVTVQYAPRVMQGSSTYSGCAARALVHSHIDGHG
jgi:hypothetical protein